MSNNKRHLLKNFFETGKIPSIDVIVLSEKDYVPAVFNGGLPETFMEEISRIEEYILQGNKYNSKRDYKSKIKLYDGGTIGDFLRVYYNWKVIKKLPKDLGDLKDFEIKAIKELCENIKPHEYGRYEEVALVKLYDNLKRQQPIKTLILNINNKYSLT